MEFEKYRLWSEQDLFEENKLMIPRQLTGDKNIGRIIQLLQRQKELCEDLNNQFDKAELIALHLYLSEEKPWVISNLLKKTKEQLCSEIYKMITNTLSNRSQPTSPIPNQSGTDLLIKAIDAEDGDTIVKLLEEGVDPNQPALVKTETGFYKNYPLSRSIMISNDDIAAILLKYGADPTLDTGNGSIILDSVIKPLQQKNGWVFTPNVMLFEEKHRQQVADDIKLANILLDVENIIEIQKFLTTHPMLDLDKQYSFMTESGKIIRVSLREVLTRKDDDELFGPPRPNDEQKQILSILKNYEENKAIMSEYTKEQNIINYYGE